MNEVTELDRLFLDACIDILGFPVKVYREYNKKTAEYEWTVFGRMFGKSGRLDVSIYAKDAYEQYALDRLLAQIPVQLMDWYERNTEFGSPWFPLKRSELPQNTRWQGATLYVYVNGQELIYHIDP